MLSKSMFMRVNALLIGLFLTAATHAATLNMDPAKSQITLSGTVAGSALREQGPGSLTTTVGGTIDITAGGGQIQITGAHLDPNLNGSWSPGRGSDATSPADFAGQASSFLGTITGALRDLLVTAASPAKALAANGQFDASSIVFSFPTNANSVLDYNAGFLGKGSKPLASNGTNQTATVGTLVESNGTQTLTIALDATFSFSLITDNDAVLRLQGQLVATGAPAGGNSPKITGIEIVNNQVKITAGQTSEATRLQSTTTLSAWSAQDATIVSADSTTRVFTVPMTERFQFFRLTQ